MRRMVGVTLEMGHDHFLVHEVARALPVVEAAVEAGVGGQMLNSLACRAREASPAAQLEAEREADELPSIRIVVRALGECTVQVDDRALVAADWGTAKAKELFFYLISFPARRKDQIGQVLWPDLSPGRLRSAFHVTLYRLRRALGVSDCVLYENEQYAFNRQLDYRYDVDEFEALVAQAERLLDPEPLEAEKALEEACALYRGPYLDGMDFPDEEWCFWRREELARRHQGALQTLGDLRQARAEYDAALEVYRRLLAADPLREDTHRDVMRCLALGGDRNAALRHYQTLVGLLLEQLGVEPLPETVELYEAIAMGVGAPEL